MGIRDNIAKRFHQITAEFTSALTVGHRLDLHNAQIQGLPDNLTVGGDLDLRYTNIATPPANLRVGGKIYPESLRCAPSRQSQEDLTIPGQAKELYEAASHRLDPDGFVLFRSAEDLLGKLDYSVFAYEDTIGTFEEADGYELLKYLLVAHCDQLGESNINCNRWEVVKGTPYEECVCLSIDETTPEYRQFEETLYRNACKKLGVQKEPSEKTLEERTPTVKKEEQIAPETGKVSTMDTLESNVRKQLCTTPQTPAPVKMPALER